MTRGPRVVAVLGGVGDGVAHPGDAALVHQVDDQLELVQALEVGDLRGVAGLGQHLEAGLHQRGGAAAEHRLLAEEVGLGLLGEGGLDDAGPGAADGLRVGQRERDGAAGGVLLDGDQHRHALAVDELAAHQVTRALRRDHRDVDIGRRRDQAVPDVEAVAEEQRLAGGQGRRDVLGVDLALRGVRRQDHDHVGLGRRLGRRDHAQALLLGLGPALRALRQADPDVDTGVAQRQRVRVALAAVADDGDLAALDDRQVGVVVVENFCGQRRLLLTSVSYAARRLGAVIDREPRPIATRPDCTISLIPNGSRSRSSASSLSAVPVASMVSASGGDVDDPGPEQRHGLQHLGPHRPVGPHLDQQQLALHRLASAPARRSSAR